MWIVLLALALGPGVPDAPVVPPHVRAASDAARSLLIEAAASPTIAALLRRLESSDQIVYVEFTGSSDIPTARTKLVAAARGVRFLRIDINTRIVPWDRLPLLAHELQHAVELADAPDVRDNDGVRRLYARIGRQGDTDRFETQAAIAIERRVRGERVRATARQ